MLPIWEAVLRAAREADVDRVMQFYRDNPSTNVLPREGAVRTACEQGLQFLIETEAGIIGVAGSYPINRTLIEVGGTRVADAWSGFKLQDLLFKARFAAIVLFENADTRISTGVDPVNAAASLSGILEQGFEPWEEPASELLVECDPGPGRDGCSKKLGGLVVLPAKCCCTFYLMPPSTLRTRIGEFLAATSGAGIIERTRKEKAGRPAGTLRVHVKTASITQSSMREDLEAYCRGD